MIEVSKWLSETGRKITKDYEFLVRDIEHRNTKKTIIPSNTIRPSGRVSTKPLVVQSLDPILFFNDPQIGTYAKLKWGGY